MSSETEWVPPLWHYTSAASALAIFESKTLWATNIRYLNDSAEFLHAVRRTKKFIEEHSTWDAYSRALMELMISTLQTDLYISDYTGLSTYVISFSGSGDSLSMWRGYGGQNSLALGFDRDKLTELAEKQGFRLIECSYSEELKSITKYIDEFLASAIPKLSPLNLSSNKLLGYIGAWGGMPEELKSVHRTFLDEFSYIAASEKHHSFKEEKEWRLIFQQPENDRKKINLRAGKRTLIPYINFSITNEDGSISLRQIVVSPSDDRGQNLVSASMLFNLYQIDIQSFHTSIIPYRDW